MSPPRPAVALLHFLLLCHVASATMAEANTSATDHNSSTSDTSLHNQSRGTDIQTQPASNSTANDNIDPTIKEANYKTLNCTSNITAANQSKTPTKLSNIKTMKPLKDYVISYKRFSKRNKIEDSTLVSSQLITKRNRPEVSRTNETSEKRSSVRGRKQSVASRFIEFLPKTAAMRLPDQGTGPVRRRAVVSLLGLFELSTRHGARPEGKSELAAARLAVKHINDKKLLPGYTLELLTNDTQTCWTIMLDRCEAVRYDPKVSDVNCTVSKVNRTSFALNFNMNLYVEVSDFEVDIRMYGIYSNRYRELPVIIKRNCQIFNFEYQFIKQEIQGKFFDRCPIKKGFYYIKNFIPDAKHFRGLPWKVANYYIKFNFTYNNQKGGVLKVYYHTSTDDEYMI